MCPVCRMLAGLLSTVNLILSFCFRNQPNDGYIFQPKHVADFIKK